MAKKIAGEPVRKAERKLERQLSRHGVPNAGDTHTAESPGEQTVERRSTRSIADILAILNADLEAIPPLARGEIAAKLAALPTEIPSRNGVLRFVNINRGSFGRACTLHTKEPDSIRWIDRMAPGSVFWDIGANVGVFSLYAAQRGDLHVHAFEPAAVNYYLLTANCELNGFQDVLSCYLLGFSDQTRVARIEATQFAAAASFSFKGNENRPEFAGHYQTCLLFSIDDFLERFCVPFPNYIKIDVPGLTAEIFRGAVGALARPELREIQVELSEHSKKVQGLLAFIATFGFRIVHRNRRPHGLVMELVLGRGTGETAEWE